MNTVEIPLPKQTTETQSSPADFGFYMPAEWALHERCWMMWPTRKNFWDDIEKTRFTFAKIAKTIRRFEPVTVVVSPEHKDHAAKLLGPDIELLERSIDDSWARDAGPNFLINKHNELAGSTWRFNAWGNKYQPHDHDDALGSHILEHTNARAFTSSLIAEGGAITVDGEGTIITTESCLLNPSRNPGWSKQEVEDELMRTLGAEKVIWLPGNPDEKETDGHVDGMAQFVRPGVVLMETSYDLDHPWYNIFQENIAALEGQTDAKGRPLDRVMIEDGHGTKMLNDRFCTSYINSYLANNAVVMPKYGIAADERARAVYQRIFPDREIVQIEIDGIAVGGGGIHCITQQQPKQRP